MLSVRFELAQRVKLPNGTVVTLSWGNPILCMENRGSVVYYCCPGPFTAEGVQALNVSVEKLLDGGQWFQLWGGEVVSINTPETPGVTNGRVHRGQVV